MNTVFVNAHVITMNQKAPFAEAFAVANGRFLSVGTAEQVKQLAGAAAPVVDLAGRTVIPGLIETHAHLSYYALSLTMVDCTSTANESVEDIKKRLKAKAETIQPGGWISGWGYDDTLMAEGRHLTRQDLDEAAPHHHVLFTHISTHLAYANTLALQRAGVGPATADPPGGIIHKDAYGVPSGLLIEPAAMDLVADLRPLPDVTVFQQLIPHAVAHYHREGVTSVHDAAIGMIGEGKPVMKAYTKLLAENRLRLRVYTTLLEKVYRPLLDYGLMRGYGSGDLRLGAVKSFQDGSIQGLTAALKKDYLCRPGFTSRLAMPQPEIDQFVERHHRLGLQVAIHANGDAAIESVIQAFEKAQTAYPQADSRHMIIHCQMASDDHLQRMKQAGIIPSFFVNHVYYWGDRHIRLFLGEERAARIDPLASAVRAGLPFTLHADTPVTPISPIFSMHNAVNRLTRDGVKLGADQCITPYQALEAYTANAARCSFEEGEKGTIEPGKLADFAVLSKDILSIAPETLKDASVLETWMGGKQVFKAMRERS